MKTRIIVHFAYFTALTLVIGIAAAVAANVTVPNTFTAGTTAKANEVNANFTTLETAMPAVKQTPSNTWIAIPDGSVNAASMDSLTITPPADGFAIVTVTGALALQHNTSVAGYYCLDLDTTADNVSGCAPMSGSKSAVRGFLPDNYPVSPSSLGIPYTIVESYPVTADTPVTFHLNGYQTGFDSAWLFHQTITVLFVPNALP